MVELAPQTYEPPICVQTELVGNLRVENHLAGLGAVFVNGVDGGAPDSALVFSGVSEGGTPDVPNGEVAYLGQSPVSVREDRLVVDVPKRRTPHIQGPPAPEVCLAHQNGQRAVRECAQRAGVLFGVRCHHSSNVRLMFRVGYQVPLPGCRIADGAEIVPRWRQGVCRAAVKAGASAAKSRVRSTAFEDVGVAETVPEAVTLPLPSARRGAQALTPIAVKQ